MSSRLALLLGLACALPACRKEPPAPAQEVAGTTAKPPDDPCAKAKPEGVIAWIHDDYAAALACAKAKNLPIVIDLWAPWCHTCLSMQSTVFTDKSFANVAGKFVFVALDTDRDANAPAVAKFPPGAWPTFYVVGPDEAVLARFVGAASVAQFHAFLDDGTRAKSGGAAGADAHLLAAERALATKDVVKAEQELVAALVAAPTEWARRPDALVSLIGIRRKSDDLAGCLSIAEMNMHQTGNAASATDFLSHAMSCAAAALKEASKKSDTGTTVEKTAADKALAERVKKLREAAVARLQKLVDDPAAPLSVDDRSDALNYLRETLIDLDKKPDAKLVAEKQLAMLDDAAAKAATPMAAMTYNWPRSEVYAYLERPLDLVPALEKSAKDLPREYDPPYRLGWIYLKGGKLAEAAKWTDAAVRLAYGPRKVRVLNQRVEIANKQRDKEAERLFRQEIVKTLQALPAGQTTPEAIAKAKQALVDLDAPPKPPATGPTKK